MPCLKITTNLLKSQIPKGFTDRVIPILSRTVGKPEDRFICVIVPDCLINFRGENEKPCVAATLESIGNIDKERNKQVMKEMSEFITKELGVPSERFFLTFYDVPSYCVGLSGTTIS